MKKLYKIISSFIAAIGISLSSFSMLAFAIDENEEDFATRHAKVEPIWETTRYGTRQVPKGGGMNILDNVMAYTLKDLDQLEQALIERGYVLVNTSEKQITDEEFDLLYNNEDERNNQMFYDYAHGFDFSQYPEYGIQNAKIYMYRPTLNDALRDLKNDGYVSDDIGLQLNISSVVLNYRACYENEQIGKIVNYYNENIPPWLKTTDKSTGFLQISSKINVRVLLEDKFRFIKDEIYIPKGKSVLIELPVGSYDFNAVNEKVDISLDEEAISHNNQITILDTNTKDNPRVFDLTALEEKYNIQPISDDEVKTHLQDSIYDETSENNISVSSSNQSEEKKESHGNSSNNNSVYSTGSNSNSKSNESAQQLPWQLIAGAIGGVSVISVVVVILVKRNKK